MGPTAASLPGESNARHDEYSVAYSREAARRAELEAENAELRRALARSGDALAAVRRAPEAARTALRAVAGRLGRR